MGSTTPIANPALPMTKPVAHAESTARRSSRRVARIIRCTRMGTASLQTFAAKLWTLTHWLPGLLARSGRNFASSNLPIRISHSWSHFRSGDLAQSQSRGNDEAGQDRYDSMAGEGFLPTIRDQGGQCQLWTTCCLSALGVQVSLQRRPSRRFGNANTSSAACRSPRPGLDAACCAGACRPRQSKAQGSARRGCIP